MSAIEIVGLFVTVLVMGLFVAVALICATFGAVMCWRWIRAGYRAEAGFAAFGRSAADIAGKWKSGELVEGEVYDRLLREREMTAGLDSAGH